MNPEGNGEGHLRKYLLGELDEAEQQATEERLLKEDKLFDLLLVAEDELVDDYLGGELSGHGRKRFESFFLSTPERQRKLSFAMALRRYVTAEVAAEAPTKLSPRVTADRSSWWRQAFSTPYLRLAAAALIILAIGLGTWRVFFQRPETSNGIAALREAYRDQRPTEARITGLNYAEPPSTTRGSQQEKLDYLARDRARALIQLEANEHPSAQSYHDLGRLYLAEHEFDKAIDQFEKALKLDEKNAQLHSDYGAALIEIAKAFRSKGEAGKSLEAFAKSLEQLNRAIDLNTSLREAVFNRALCYEGMVLPRLAEQDWRTYLEKDSISKWADEARRKLKELEERNNKISQTSEQLYQGFLIAYQAKDDGRGWKALREGRARTGNVITERLLDSYLGSVAYGRDDEAIGYLNMISYAGDLEYRKTGDRFTEDLAAFYQRVSPRQRRVVGEARRLMKAAAETYEHEEHDKTVELYDRARRLFALAGDSCEAAVAECWTGIANLRIDAKRSLLILEPLSRILNEREYKYLLAQGLNGRADGESSQRSFSKTLNLGKLAFDLSEQIEDVRGMLRNSQFPVAMHQRFGDYRQSLSHIARAFDLASRFSPEPHELWPFYQQTAFNLYSLQLFAAALDSQREALRLAIASGLPLLKSRSYARLGLIDEKLGDEEEAIKNGELALAVGQTIKSKKSRENVVANSALNLAYLYRQRGDLARAVTYYDQAIQLHNALNIEIYLFEAHKGKLISLIGLHDDRAAEAEMKTAIEVIEQYRPKILEESNRIGFFDLAQSIYDLAIDFSYSRMHDDQQAFQYAEFSHARSLLDLMKTNAKVINGAGKPDVKLPDVTSPLTITDIRQQLPNDVRVLEFSVLDDKILIWVISQNDIVSKESPVAASRLNQRVRRYLDLIAKPDETAYGEAASIANELYDLLISPVEPLLGANGYLCIVPDKILTYLPFGALISPRSSYFVEDHCFGLAPSASIFLAASERASQMKKTGSESFLGIGNPSFDRSRFPDLPIAAKEVTDIARFYTASLPLCGDRAREGRVKYEMKRANVIHLASHYVVDEQSPMLSKLLLAVESEPANQPDEDGFLQASEVYDMQLPRTRLVVLSACQTGIERSYQGEGAISIARPFMKAGVPVVVASLWPVESDSTSRLMTDLHSHRKEERVSTAEALRRAQRHMLHSADERYRHPYYWASFAALGGYAKF